MIREAMIDAERDYVDERLCGVNDMTFEEWERYQNQMLRYYSVYQYDNGPYEEEDESNSSEEDESSNEDDEWDENHRSCPCNNDLCLSRVIRPGWHSGQNEDNESNEDDESDDDNHDSVCLCDPTDFNAGTCCRTYLGLECDGQCHPNGYDRWLEAWQVTL